jgi:hypothetical protein
MSAVFDDSLTDSKYQTDNLDLPRPPGVSRQKSNTQALPYPSNIQAPKYMSKGNINNEIIKVSNTTKMPMGGKTKRKHNTEKKLKTHHQHYKKSRRCHKKSRKSHKKSRK